MTSDGLTTCICSYNDCAKPAEPGQLFCRFCLTAGCPNVLDIQTSGPADCAACKPGPAACLSHTCPDCGHNVHALTNTRNELVHSCPGS